MKKYSFTKAERLTKNSEFRRVFRKGKSFSNSCLKVYIHPTNFLEDKPVRLGLVLTRKLGKAVKRNKLKRRLREFFRLHKHLLKPGLEIIFLPRDRAIDRNYDELEKSIISIFLRAKIFRDNSSAN